MVLKELKEIRSKPRYGSVFCSIRSTIARKLRSVLRKNIDYGKSILKYITMS